MSEEKMDIDYYENSAHWDVKKYQSDFEYKRLLRAAGLVPPEVRSMADVGCGNGLFLKLLETIRPDIEKIGIERSAAAIEARQCVSRVARSSAERLPFKSRSRDLVSCLAVIEHLTEDVYRKALDELERVADRFILINVPHNERRVFVKCPACACRFNPSFHLRSYGAGSYSALFRDFAPVKIEYERGPEPLISWVVRRLPVHLSANRYADAVCPQCNWRPETRIAAPRSTTSGVKAVLRRLPPIIEVREAFILYRRSGSG
jgi:SAM-dependent methyltransferase